MNTINAIYYNLIYYISKFTIKYINDNRFYFIIPGLVSNSVFNMCSFSDDDVHE